MPHHDTIDITALRALSVIAGNGGTKGRTPKLASVKVGSADSVYMLATFCFDLYRRLQYVSKVARPLLEHIPPEIAREMLEDNEVIDGGPGWRERAEAAEAIMLRLNEELSDDWERALKRAAEGSAH